MPPRTGVFVQVHFQIQKSRWSLLDFLAHRAFRLFMLAFFKAFGFVFFVPFGFFFAAFWFKFGSGILFHGFFQVSFLLFESGQYIAFSRIGKLTGKALMFAYSFTFA